VDGVLDARRTVTKLAVTLAVRAGRVRQIQVGHHLRAQGEVLPWRVPHRLSEQAIGRQEMHPRPQQPILAPVIMRLPHGAIGRGAIRREAIVRDVVGHK
jgi:hypothetical protein